MSLYQALEAGHIRLLKFLDESGQRCTIGEHSLDDAPEYWTLSYTWNDDRPDDPAESAETYEVEVNGESFAIQKNLAAAFKCLAPRAYQLGKYMWADYICINQKDDVEKGVQVRMMKDIYARAKVVRAWLGVPWDEEKVRLAVELITSLGASWRRGSVVMPGDIDLEMREKRPGFPTEDPKSMATWQGIKELFEKSFWERTWCHLECSKNDIRFYCGDHSFDSFDFRIFGTAMHVYQRLPGFDGTLRFTKASRLFNARIHRDDEHESLRLLPLLSEIRPTQCFDPRDKVFAALPHATDVPEDSALIVDYSKSLVEVYTDVVRFSLEQNHSLQFLGYVSTIDPEENETPSPAMPSWVPDWRATNIFTSLTDGKDSTSYDVCPGTTLTAEISGTELNLQGYTLDTLAALTDAGYQHNDIFEAVISWRSQVFDSGMQFPDAVINRTVTGNSLMAQIDEQQEETHKRWDEIDWEAIMDPKTPADGWNRDHIHDVLSRFCMARRMGYTTDAEQLGLFPLNAQIGDKIMAFDGGKTLYLTREVSDSRHRFVGEWYVSGLMDGLVIDLVREQNSSSECIILA